jgi:hypothetical protein
MKTDRPFKVINCLSQGFAVAGPVLADGQHKRHPDFEMVLWGVSFEKACEMADDLNADSSAGGASKLQHVKD